MPGFRQEKTLRFGDALGKPKSHYDRVGAIAAIRGIGILERARRDRCSKTQYQKDGGEGVLERELHGL
jgi:hypothetical protein